MSKSGILEEPSGVEISHFVIFFSSLFALILSKEDWVAEISNPEDARGSWTHRFSRALNDWELDYVERFLLKIQTTRIHRDVGDKVIWTASRCGNFSIKSLYSILQPEDPILFPSSSI